MERTPKVTAALPLPLLLPLPLPLLLPQVERSPQVTAALPLPLLLPLPLPLLLPQVERTQQVTAALPLPLLLPQVERTPKVTIANNALHYPGGHTGVGEEPGLVVPVEGTGGARAGLGLGWASASMLRRAPPVVPVPIGDDALAGASEALAAAFHHHDGGSMQRASANSVQRVSGAGAIQRVSMGSFQRVSPGPGSFRRVRWRRNRRSFFSPKWPCLRPSSFITGIKNKK